MLKKRFGGVLAALFVLSAVTVRAEEPGVRFGVLSWTQAAFSAEAHRVTLGGRVSIDGPLALGAGAPFRIYVDLDLTATPGQSLDFANVETFGRSAELNLGAYRRIGGIEIGGQRITTALFGEWGFATALEDEPAVRYVRHYAGGLRVAEEASGAELFIGYGRHEAGGERGWGQWILAGQVPLTASHGIVVLGGDAILSVGPRGRAGQRDVFRVYVGVQFDTLLKVIAGA